MADINRARMLVARGDHEAATQELVDILHNNGRNIEAWLMLADLVEDPDERKDCYNQILKIDPSNQQARLQLNLLGGKPAMKFGKAEPRRAEKAPEAPAEPPPGPAVAIAMPVPQARTPLPPSDPSLSLEMQLRSDLAQGPIFDSAPEAEPEEQPPARTLTVDTIKDTLNAAPAKITPVVKKSARKIYHNPLFQILMALLAIGIVAVLFYTYFARVVPNQAPANLIVGPSKKFIPPVTQLPAGFKLQETTDSPVISQANAEGYRLTYTNPDFAIQEREVNVTYEVTLYNSVVDAEVALQNATNPATYKSLGKSVESSTISPTQLAQLDSSALMFGQDQNPGPGASLVSYILALRQANLFSRVVVSAPVDSVESPLAQSMRTRLYQSVFYYASLLTRQLPLPARAQVSLNLPTFPPPVAAKPTPTLEATARPPDNVLFRDRFDDPAASQQNWTIVSGAWTFDNGRLACQAPSFDCQAFAGEQDWKDYTFSVDVQGVEGSDRLVYVGVVPGKKLYLIRFQSDPVNELTLTEQVDGKPDREIKKVSFKNYNRMVYRLSIVTKATNIKILIDSIPVMAVTDAKIDLSGQIGLGLFQSTVKDALPATAWFDNVEVSVDKK
jgi:hypothetical protein